MDEESDDKDDTKRKSRNLSEKKRRDQFNSLVNDLSALITTSNRKMDKSTVLKSTIAFLKNHNEATDRSKVFEIQQDWKPTFITNDEFTHLMLESLDGFMMVFGSMGSIFYTSESITSQLGYLPHELYNMSIYDLAYEMDHEALLNIFLNPTPLIEPHQTDIETSNQITFYTHLKRGGIEKADSNSYELVKFVGYFRHDANVNTGSNSSDSQSSSSQTLPRIFQQNPNVEVDKSLVFVGTGRIQTPQLIREMSIIDPTSNEFTSKHSMEWKFLFLDHRAPPIIGYMPFEVLGTSGYDYYHFDDLDAIVACHEELRQNGEGKSCYYRFLTKGQQWIWLQTDYYVSYHQYTSKPDYVVCTHKVVSYAEVLKQNKKDRKKANKAQASNSNSSSKCASATTTLRDFELSHQSLDSTLLNTTLANLSNEVAAAAAADATSPEIDASPMWSGAGAATAAGSSCPVNSMKTSRPASSYGNISSTGISPKAKRKCYFYTNRGNDSDSTSMSAESVTSRQSLMTHASSQSQRSRSHHGREHINNNHHQHQQQQHQQQQQQQQHITHHHLHQQQLQPKIVPMLPLAPTQIVTSNPCSFPQANYPLTSPQLVAPSFLEPPQYLAAIPMQPVMAPFPVAPVLSPLPLPVSVPVSVSLPMPVQSQADMLPGAVVMTSTQSHLQDQLQRKHDELQKLIMQQQDELRIVSEQLLLARYTYLQPMMPMGFAASNMAAAAAAVGNAAGVNVQRSFNFSGTNTVEPQFNQYGFALNSEQMLNQQDQQMLMQQQQNLHNQQQHNHQIQQHQQQQNQLQQQQQQLQHQQQQLQLQQQHHQQQQQQLQQQQQQQQQQQSASSMLSREDIEDIDAFLNLSPLQTLGSSNNNNNNNNNSSNNNNNNSNAPQNTNEDSLLSYMQMATESSPSLNFPMGISDDGSETHSEKNKMLRTSSQSLQHHQQQLQQQQQQHQQHHHNQQLLQQQQQQLLQSHQQSNSFFSSNPFQSLSGNHQNQSHQQLPNDLEILPYQMSQEQSQNLFNSPHTANSSQ